MTVLLSTLPQAFETRTQNGVAPVTVGSVRVRSVAPEMGKCVCPVEPANH